MRNGIASQIICWFAQSIRCVLITPLGDPVDPDVKRILAMVSGPTRAAASSTSSVTGVAVSAEKGVVEPRRFVA